MMQRPATKDLLTTKSQRVRELEVTQRCPRPFPVSYSILHRGVDTKRRQYWLSAPFSYPNFLFQTSPGRNPTSSYVKFGQFRILKALGLILGLESQRWQYGLVRVDLGCPHEPGDIPARLRVSPVTVTSGVSTELGPPPVTVEGHSDRILEKTLGMLGNPHERVMPDPHTQW